MNKSYQNLRIIFVSNQFLKLYQIGAFNNLKIKMQTPQRLENQKKEQVNGQKFGGARKLTNNSSKTRKETTDTLSVQDVALPSISDQKRRKLLIQEEQKHESDYYNEGALDTNYAAQSKQSYTVQKSNIKARNLGMRDDKQLSMSQVAADNGIENQKDRIKASLAEGNTFKQSRNSAATELSRGQFNKLQMSRDSASLRKQQQRDRLEGVDVLSPMSMPATQRNGANHKDRQMTIDNGHGPNNFEVHRNSFLPTISVGASKKLQTNAIQQIHQNDLYSNSQYETGPSKNRFKNKIYNIQDDMDAIQASNMMNMASVTATERFDKSVNYQPSNEHDYDTEVMIRQQKNQAKKVSDFRTIQNGQSSMTHRKRKSIVQIGQQQQYQTEDSHSFQRRHETEPHSHNLNQNYKMPNNPLSPQKLQAHAVQNQSLSSSPVKKRRVYKIALSDIKLKDQQFLSNKQNKTNITSNQNLNNDVLSQQNQNLYRGKNTGQNTPERDNSLNNLHASPDVTPNQMSRYDADLAGQHTFSSQVKYAGQSYQGNIIQLQQANKILDNDLSDDSISEKESGSSPAKVPNNPKELYSQSRIVQHSEQLDTDSNYFGQEPQTAKVVMNQMVKLDVKNLKIGNQNFKRNPQLFNSEKIANPGFKIGNGEEASNNTLTSPTQKKTIYIDFGSKVKKPQPQMRPNIQGMPSQKLLIQKKIHVKPLRKDTFAHNTLTVPLQANIDEESSRTNSRGIGGIDNSLIVNNQIVNQKQQNVPSSGKGHKPQLAKLGSKLAVNSGPKNLGRTLQAAGLGLIGVSGTEKVSSAQEKQQQQIIQGKIQSQQTKLQIQENKSKIQVVKKSSLALRDHDIHQTQVIYEQGQNSKRSDRSKNSDGSHYNQRADQIPSKIHQTDRSNAEFQEKQHMIKESMKAMRAKQLPGSNKNVHKMAQRDNKQSQFQSLQQNQVKRKKGKKGFDNYVAGDSSDASDGVKYIKMGQEIGNKVKVVPSTFCKEYYSNSQFNQRYKDNFSRIKFRAKLLKNNEIQYFTSSERIYVGKELIDKFDTRKEQPILIVNLDGALGYWDLSKEMYILRSKVVESLIILSQDFVIVAVSHQRKAKIRKLVHQFQKIAYQDQQINSYTQSFTHKNITFDAVYHLKSQFAEEYQISTGVNMLENNQNNHVDQVQCDLTQIFIDLQIFNINQQIETQQNEKRGSTFELEGLTIENYNPMQRVLIFTSKQYSLQSACYSFDFNHYFQIMAPYSKRAVYRQIPNPDECQFSPLILTVPHLRTNHKVPFDSVHAVIFATLNMAYQNAKIIIKNQIIKNKLNRDTTLRKLHNEKEKREREREEKELETGSPQSQTEEDEHYRQYIIQSEQQAFIEEQIIEEIDPPQDEVDESDKPINIPYRRLFKKMFCANFSKLNKRVKQQKYQTLRVFDPNLNYALKNVMQNIDFFYSYKQFKYHLKSLNAEEKMQYDWLKFKAYKLQPKDPELLKNNPDMPNSYVSNINSKYTKEIKSWDEQMKILDPDNPKFRGPTQPKHYQTNEDAKNLYNSLFSKNRHNLKEITTYKNQYKEAMNKRRKIMPKIDPNARQQQQQIQKNNNRSTKSVSSDVVKRKSKMLSKLTVVDDEALDDDKQSTSNDEMHEGDEESSPIKGGENMSKEGQEQDQDKILNIAKQESIPEAHVGELMLADDNDDSEAAKDDAEVTPQDSSQPNTQEKLEEKQENSNKQMTTEQRIQEKDDYQNRSDRDFESSHEEGDDDNNYVDNTTVKKKPYARKFRTLQIKGQGPADNDPEKFLSVVASGELDLKQFVLISLKTDIYEQLCSDTPIERDDHNQIFQQVHQQKQTRNHLTDLLSAKQRIISYSTTQDSHLQNNLSQLVGGNDQYYDMLHELMAEDDKKQRGKD